MYCLNTGSIHIECSLVNLNVLLGVLVHGPHLFFILYIHYGFLFWSFLWVRTAVIPSKTPENIIIVLKGAETKEKRGIELIGNDWRGGDQDVSDLPNCLPDAEGSRVFGDGFWDKDEQGAVC